MMSDSYEKPFKLSPLPMNADYTRIEQRLIAHYVTMLGSLMGPAHKWIYDRCGFYIIQGTVFTAPNADEPMTFHIPTGREIALYNMLLICYEQSDARLIKF
jgi:hypothetical protein